MWQVLACGAVVFPGLFFAFKKILPTVFKHWTNADVVLVSERLVSSIHALMATTAGVIIVSSCRGNIIYDRHWITTHFVIWYGVPYMTYDIFAMYLSHYYRYHVKGHEDYKQHSLRTINSFVRREFLLVLHHIALLTILLPITLFFRKDQGDFFIGCLFLTELSTPFVSLGKILIQLSLQDCWLHKANGGMVLVTFFMCRIALFPFMYWMYGRHYGIPLYSVPFHLPLSANLGNLCILAPQVYWFVLLCRKGYRLYRRSRGPQSPPVADGSKED
ncbi:TLC domain-containing protein 3A [Cyprinodon tularosa]|uniref:TLC domain containing 3A n=1 Tax=Cyprinodon variegatus TaxID=28743 RepID=A0A3Q2CN13_CYPVA|nr:PREDICTED: protein FAM57A-like [Cyprinodon variegatus]XP_038159544.1 TLC domain-containing protein 3A [Cyprinodon tularosa]